MPRYRRAGSRWRLLVHKMTPKGGNGTSYDIEGGPRRYPVPIGDSPEQVKAFHQRLKDFDARMVAEGLKERHEFPGTEFDELVVGNWIHIEQMDTGLWWMNIAGVTVHVKADRDGNPKHVSVAGPGDYDLPVDGCTYGLFWSMDCPEVP